MRCEVTSAAGAGNKSCAASNGAGDMIKNMNMTEYDQVGGMLIMCLPLFFPLNKDKDIYIYI